MRIAFEPSGTHLKGDSLKIRLDLFPDVGEKSYAQNYVYVPVIPVGGYPGKVGADGSPASQKAYDTWLAGLPHIWRLNPCLSVFVRVDENITSELLTQFIGDVYKSDVLATIDDAMGRTGLGSAHLISPYMKDKTTLSSVKTTTFDAATKTFIETRLSGLSIIGVTGKAEIITPQSIDVGPGATDRAGSLNSNNTLVDKANPANATGTLDTFETWVVSVDMPTCEIATFYVVSGDNLSTRDNEAVGNVAFGAKRTFTGLTIAVTTGDYLGIKGTAGGYQIEGATSGGSGVWGKTSDYIPCTNETFGVYANYVVSIYATGTEAGGGWTHIAKASGAGQATILKINGVAKANIAKVNGVAV